MSAAVAPEPRADTRPSRRRVWRWMRRVGIVLGLVLAGVRVLSVLGALVSRQDISLDELQAVGAGAARIRQWGLVLQCLLLGALVAFWRPLVGFAYRRAIVKRHELRQVLRLRWHVAAWGLLYLVLIPIGPVNLWHLLTA